MTSATVSVIIASAQSVGKVYVIGAVGFCAVKFPRKAPLLPAKAVGTVARFGFNVLVIPLIYSTIANSVTPATVGDYWFILVAAFFVLSISYLTATLLGCCIRLDKRDFHTLRISATFPNIVALPILIFPSLCEYPVVHEGFSSSPETEDMDAAQLYQKCVTNANTMIFIYFFTWSILFWSLGYRSLMMATKLHHEDQHEDNSDDDASSDNTATPSLLRSIWNGIKQTLKSPGFLAMLCGFVTGCIPPLQQALFDNGGALRFLGAAAQTLGRASSPMSTMVVAASLVPPTRQEQSDEEGQESTAAASSEHACPDQDDGIESRADDVEEGESSCGIEEPTQAQVKDDVSSHHEDTQEEDEQPQHEESPIMSDPNFGPHNLRRRSSIQRFRQTIRRSSARLVSSTARARPTPQLRRLLLWFCASRLIVTPAIVVSIIVGLDSTGWFTSIPGLAKLVVIINAALPGALIVVVLLKSRPETADTAAVVAKVYLPSYLLSIVTIAAWTAIGLWISLPTT